MSIKFPEKEALAVQKEFKRIGRLLQQTSAKLREDGYSHPIFILSPHVLTIGALLLQPKELHENHYYCHITHLEQLERAGYIAKIGSFIAHYPDPYFTCCICMVNKVNSFFIHLPYLDY